MADCPTGILISFDEDDVKRPITPKRALTYSSDQEPSKFKNNLLTVDHGSPKTDKFFSPDCSSTSLLEDQNVNLIPAVGNDDEIFVIPFDDKTYVKKTKRFSAKQMVEVFTEASKIAARFQFLSAAQDKENILPEKEQGVAKLAQFALNIPSFEDLSLDDSVFTHVNSLTTSITSEYSSLQSTNVDKKDSEESPGDETPSFDSPTPSATFCRNNLKSVTPDNLNGKTIEYRQPSSASSSSLVSTESYDVLAESDSIKLNESNASSTMPLIKKSALIRPGFADRSLSASSLSSCCSTEEISNGKIGGQKSNLSTIQKSMSLHIKSRSQIKPLNGPMKAFAQPKSVAPRKAQSFRDVPAPIKEKPITPSVKEITDKSKSSTPLPAKSKLKRSIGTPVRSTWTPKSSRENSEYGSSTPCRRSTATTSTPVASHLVKRRSLLSASPKSSCSSITSLGSKSSFCSTDSPLKIKSNKSGTPQWR